MEYTIEREIGSKKLSIESGKVAKQAAGSVLVRYGDGVVLAAVTRAEPREGFDFFPLTVDYREKGYAAGKIFGGRFRKREGAPSEKEILTMRLIDRPIRPLFPEGYCDDVLVQTIVLSADPENDPDVLAMIGASAALAVSPVPFYGPTASVRVGRVNNQLVLNPSYKEIAESTLNLVVAGTRDAVTMVECSALELTEDDMVEAIVFGHNAVRTIAEAIDELVRQVNPKKIVVPAVDDSLVRNLKSEYLTRAIAAARTPTKAGRREALADLRKEISAKLVKPDSTDAPSAAQVEAAFEKLQEAAVRACIMERRRVDGRAPDQIRDITSEVSFLPYTHGSALFTRGETQAIATVTIGTLRDQLLVEGLEGESNQRFMLHYNFPSFCVGETKPPRGPGRREIGHGELARRALMAVIPPYESFPYIVRVVSEITESNGSSSMATVCSGCLALMDAGIPIARPVAGIAMGLAVENGRTVVLSDILGDEDHYGDMDFKVAGTQNGITALQMDIKCSGLTPELMRQALGQAREGRIHILREMLKTLSAPRPEIAEHAPKIIQIKVDTDKIGKIIGPGGKTVRGMEERYGVTIDIEEDGTVLVAAPNTANAESAAAEISGLVETPQVGKVYEGEVRSIREFGVFVEILPGTDGMCHVSELDTAYVKDPADVVKVGERIKVKVVAIDDLGRIRLSRKALMAPAEGDAETAGVGAEDGQGNGTRHGRPHRSGGGRGPSGGPNRSRRGGAPRDDRED